MRARLWPAVAVSFGALILLSVAFALLVSTKAARIHERTRSAHQVYRLADDAISDIQANINKGALLEQSGFHDPSGSDAEGRISALEVNTGNDLNTLTRLIGANQRPQIFALRQGLDQFWSSIRQSLSTARMQSGEQKLFTELENQPEKVLDLAGRIDALNQASLARQEQESEAQQTKLRRFAITATFILLALEFAIAIFSTAYMFRLDNVSETERQRAEKAEQELRHLSNQLVKVQEEERKTISRELHDEVGQILTGLRMELGTLSHYKPDEEYRQRLESVKRLAEEALRSVRNLALLVRPSMLDDLGLEPALQWQVKEFSRRCGIPASLQIEGSVDHLPEALRLCIYRAIQEAMTNCVKHAEARHVSVAVKHDETRVTACVQDDGKGFDVRLKSPGLGLLGMTERVRALQGRVSVSSAPGSGTRIHLELPAIKAGVSG